MPDARAPARLPRPVRALSFDAYGTLLEGGTDDLVTLLGALAERHKLPVGAKELLVEREDLIAQLDRKPFLTMRERDRWILTTLFTRHGISGSVEPHVDALYQAHLAARPYPGAREALDALAHLPRVLVTNADVDMMEHVLRQTGLTFDAVITSEAVRAYKPAPVLFTRALEHLGVPAESVLHVGDSFIADIVGAKRAGMMAAWVTKPKGLPRRPGEAAEPDLVVGSVADLVSHLAPGA